MSVFTECRCGKKLKFQDSYAGKTVPCPGCDRNIRIPGQRSETSPSPQRAEQIDEADADDVWIESKNEGEYEAENESEYEPESDEPNFDDAVAMMDDCEELDEYTDDEQDDEDRKLSYEEAVGYTDLPSSNKKKRRVECPDCGDLTDYPAAACQQCRFPFDDGNCAGCGKKFKRPRKPACKCNLKPLITGTGHCESLCVNCGRNHQPSLSFSSDKPCPWCGAKWLIKKINKQLHTDRASSGLGYSNQVAYKPTNTKNMDDEELIDELRALESYTTHHADSLARAKGVNSLNYEHRAAALSDASVQKWSSLNSDCSDRLAQLNRATDK